MNKAALLTIMAANLVVFYLAVTTDTLLTFDLREILISLSEGVPATFGLVIVGVLNGQLSADTKARIVFLRWHNALPGSEAFSRYAASDPRIDRVRLKKRYGPLPTDPREQNALWYRLYRGVEAEPPVSQVHREFLFTRDYHCISLLMLVVLGTAGFVQMASVKTAVGYILLLTVQFLLTGIDARNHGRRFVTTVLALASAGAHT